MSLGTKIKFGATTIVLLVVAGAFWGTTQGVTGNRADDVVVSATWYPIAMTHAATITVTVDGIPVISKKPKASPWSETMTVASDAVVHMSVAHYFEGLQKLDCMIMRNNAVPRGGSMNRSTPGIVECVA